MTVSGCTVDSDGDSIVKLNGEYHLSTRTANGFPLFVHAGTGAAEGEMHYVYRHKKVWSTHTTIQSILTFDKKYCMP